MESALYLVDDKNIRQPLVHAAMEEYLMLHADTEAADWLLLYENDPSVVVGKNQSLYREVNFEYLRAGGLVVRRISGGGTVVHGPGNLCFAFITRFEEFKVNNYPWFNQRLLDALHARGIPAAFNSRNDIVLNGCKISGNAQFTNRKNLLSHGTLLIDADLEKLRFALQANTFPVESKAVASVRSKVMNVSEISSWKDVSEWRQFLAASWNAVTTPLPDSAWEIIHQIAQQKMATTEWIYGRSPKTIISKNIGQLTIEQGIITDVDQEPWRTKLVGLPYHWSAIRERFSEEEAIQIF
ncbi:MAG: lipoate--protein ligase [Chitinophagales bacterium]